MTTHDLNGAVVVITGASSGIGRASALEFARKGASLILASRDAEALEEVSHECQLCGINARVVVTDVTDTDAVNRLAQAAMDMAGRIDVWVNNAGTGVLGRYEEVPFEAHERVIQTDLLGYMRSAYAILPYFKRQESGILINNISLGAWTPQPYAVSYSAAKYGLKGFAESLRGELYDWPNIHVCNLYPAVMDTPGFRDGANYTGRDVKPLPPIYDARRTARAMVRLAKRPRHTTYVGSAAVLSRVATALMPGFSPSYARFVDSALGRADPDATSSGNLFSPPSGERRIDGGFRSTAEGDGSHGGTHKVAIAATVATATLVGLYLYRRRQQH
ncbi:SDR family oxidoreductase [Halomonas sp. WWR20]